jgi:O-antigen ligase
MFALLGSAALFFSTRTARVVRRGRNLWLAYLGFAAGPVVAMAFGTRPGLRYTLLLAPGAMAVVYLSMSGGPERWTTLARRLLLVYVWGSVAAAIARPEWAFEAHSRATLLLGTRPRLVGVTATPNTLGPVAATALLIVLATSHGRWRLVNGFAAGAALVLTDSRMAMFGAVIGSIIIYIHERPYGRGLRTILATSLAALPVLVVLATDSPPETIAAVSDSRVSTQQLATLNGRVDLWQATMKEWRSNPAFGYGPGLWSPDHRREHGQRFNWAGQAHNQLVQTLGDSGILGLVGLLSYLALLIWTALVTSARSRGLTGALVALLIVRMISESSLRNPGLDVTTLLHVLTFALLIAFSVAPTRAISGGPNHPVAARSHGHARLTTNAAASAV